MLEGLGKMLGNVMDTEQITKDKIQDALEKVAKELNAPYSDFRIEISPIDADFNFICTIFHVKENKHYKIREITVKEILGD